jgi:DNA polymerase-3 subunit alpha
MAVLLYNQSCYSLLTSTLRLPELVAFCRDNGYQAVGLADQNVLHGAMEFSDLCHKAGLKPVFGLQVNVAVDDGSYPFVLYARSNHGYQELIRVSTALNTGKSALTFPELFAVQDVFIVEIEDGGYLEHLVNTGDELKASTVLDDYHHYGNVLVGLCRNYAAYDQNIQQKIRRLAGELSVPLIAMPLALYGKKDDFDAYRTIRAVARGTTVSDQRLKLVPNACLMTQSDLQQAYPAEEVAAGDRLVQQCQVDLDRLPKAALPVFETPEGTTPAVYLRGLCKAGLKKRFTGAAIPERYTKRLDYELDVILRMGYENYFLIVWDLIRFARRQNIYVGPGRGSAAGSLVAYCLGITHIDPIRYQLLFERFLNPERISLPDIDIDFPDDRRQEVFEYVRDKYGADKVSHILTFGTLAARQVIRDVGKALEADSFQIDILEARIPAAPKIRLAQVYRSDQTFRDAVNSSAKMQQVYAVALKLEGLPRHVSTHAAGIVLSDQPLTVNMPLMEDGGTLLTQYTMNYLERLGLIKMDFLSLKNLTTIAEIVDTVNAAGTPLDILHIPLDDQRTYDLICRGDTLGIFQLESEGIRALISRLQPRNFEDIAVTIALFRPGPMQNIDTYLEARRDPSRVHYLCPEVKPVLESTYGVMIYQEQIMQVAQIIAGFSLGKADMIRKAVSKKDSAALESLKSEFIQGALANGYSRQLAQQAFADIAKFANYGFNKSHSVAYALVAYQMAYLKANFPLPFYLSLLNSVIGSDAKTNEYLVECRRNALAISAPDIQLSQDRYVIAENKLILPFTAIKGIGALAARQIIDERRQNGPYDNYFRCMARLVPLKLGRGVYEALIRAGCFDRFGYGHQAMLDSLDEVFRYSELVQVSQPQGQTSFEFNLVSEPELPAVADNRWQRLQDEYDMFGFYLSGHPVEKLRPQYPQSVDSRHLSAFRPGTRILVLCQIQKLREHRTRRGEMMCFVDGYDEYGLISLAVMPEMYQRHRDRLKKNVLIAVQGPLNERRSLRADRIDYPQR